MTPDEAKERARHAEWLREDSERLEALISTMPDDLISSRIQLSFRLSQHRRELRELMGLPPDKRTE